MAWSVTLSSFFTFFDLPDWCVDLQNLVLVRSHDHPTAKSYLQAWVTCILTTNNANDFINAKGHTREKPLLTARVHLNIVNWVEWLWNLSDAFVICFCWPDDAQCFDQQHSNILIVLTNKNVSFNLFHHKGLCTTVELPT